MSKSKARPQLADRLGAAMKAVIEHAEGRASLVETVVPLPTEYAASDVIRIRQKRRLSQNQFARLLAVSVKTLQSWEQGLRTPSGPSMRLLQLFDNPEEFETVLGVAERRKGYDTQ